MRLLTISSLVTGYAALTSFAAPTNNVVSTNALASFPELPKAKIAGNIAFLNPDTDGVYRAYLADGTVIDAARLNKDQISTWLDARKSHLSEAEAASERAIYADVDGTAVPDAQLLAPPESVKPTALLAQVASISAFSRRDNSPLVAERQIPQCSATGIYCINDPGRCAIAPFCRCNSVSCVSL